MENQRKYHILIVDDNQEFREVLAFSFKHKGYVVSEAENGLQALKLISQQQPQPIDVVVSDIMMPECSGIELLERSKQSQPITPVILLITGHAEITSEQAYNKGAEALISKPFDLKVLHSLVEKSLIPLAERWLDNPLPSNGELNVQLAFENLQSAVNARVISLGRGGMFVSMEIEKFPEVNDTLSFTVKFSDPTKSLQGNGIVRWERIAGDNLLPPGVGIEFTYLDESSTQCILDFIKDHPPQAYIPIK